MLDEAGLGDVIRVNFTRILFRMETRRDYDVGSDGGDVARYLRGEEGPDPARKGAWLGRLRREQAEGKRRERVHVWRGPLSDYLLYECEWGYLPNSRAGERIKVLDLAERPRPEGLIDDHDFILIDDRLAIRMHYEAQGRFTGAEILGDEALPRYRAARDAALEASEPFDAYWSRHPQYHRRNRAA